MLMFAIFLMRFFSMKDLDVPYTPSELEEDEDDQKVIDNENDATDSLQVSAL